VRKKHIFRTYTGFKFKGVHYYAVIEPEDVILWASSYKLDVGEVLLSYYQQRGDMEEWMYDIQKESPDP